MSIPNDWITKVVGVSFVPAYPDNLHALKEAHDAHFVDRDCQQCGTEDAPRDRCRNCRGTGVIGGGLPKYAGFGPDDTEPLPAVFIRNPDNPHDANAVEVHVPGLGEVNGMIGHIPRDKAARLAPSIDAGERWKVGIGSVLIDPDHMDRPGISVVVQRAPEQEHSNG